MKVTEFDYELPTDRIAQQPVEHRDAARLLVMDRQSGMISHRVFSQLGELLRPGDLLVLNNTRVRPARLVGRKASGGRVELLLLDPVQAPQGPGVWRCLLRAARPPAIGSGLDFGQGLDGEVVAREPRCWRVRLSAPGGKLDERLAARGHTPLPPYIRRDEEAGQQPFDRERYQTVYAEVPGAVAAPTAGLHFTRELLEELEHRGINRAFLTLHVGPGTFLPVRAERVEDHRMHEERFVLPESVAAAVAATKHRGGRVVAVGTTVVRVLEDRADGRAGVAAGSGRCDLFIYPGFRFRIVDVLVTNFHLPRSTLLMLVAAFADRERVLSAYAEAIREGYRFYSYGDAMTIL